MDFFVPVISNVIDVGRRMLFALEYPTQFNNLMTVCLGGIDIDKKHLSFHDRIIAKVNNLDYIYKPVKLLYNLFKNTLITIDYYGHP